MSWPEPLLRRRIDRATCSASDGVVAVAFPAASGNDLITMMQQDLGLCGLDEVRPRHINRCIDQEVVMSYEHIYPGIADVSGCRVAGGQTHEVTAASSLISPTVAHCAATFQPPSIRPINAA